MVVNSQAGHRGTIAASLGYLCVSFPRDIFQLKNTDFTDLLMCHSRPHLSQGIVLSGLRSQENVSNCHGNWLDWENELNNKHLDFGVLHQNRGSTSCYHGILTMDCPWVPMQDGGFKKSVNYRRSLCLQALGNQWELDVLSFWPDLNRSHMD